MNAPMTHFERGALDAYAPPQSVEAEQAVLGGLLLDNRAFDLIVDAVRERDFYRADHRLIWNAIARLIDKGEPADVITVFQLLKDEGRADDTGGMEYLNDMAQNTPSAANIRGYARHVREQAMLRDLMVAGQEAVAAAVAYRREKPVEEVIAGVEATMAALLEGGASEGDLPTLGETLRTVRDKIQARIDAPEGELSGLRTGLGVLDHALDGLQGSDLIIIAGRASMGKTALAMQIGQNVALAGGVVLVFSMEMPSEQLAHRMLANLAEVPAEVMRRGRVSQEQVDAIGRAEERLASLRLVIDDRASLAVGQMRARARRVRRQHGRLDLIVVDYLQLARAQAENRTQEVSEISRGLKAIAKEAGVPVVALSQLNRGMDARPNKRPMMGDLRESGAIEQDADVILLCYRDEYYFPTKGEKGVMEINIAKHRNGATGMRKVGWKGEFTGVRDLPAGYTDWEPSDDEPPAGRFPDDN